VEVGESKSVANCGRSTYKYSMCFDDFSPFHGDVENPIRLRWPVALIPYKRIGEPEEIGRLAAFLASDYADYITGTSVYVDGGMMLYPGFESGG
jgi:NAD(P)-dependent dehydrogenase (short-subunit alcohol dehydrogenase family)